jgi:drug/metabolite transporter (DMT)-like permease
MSIAVKKHSVLGILAFAIGIFSLLGLCLILYASIAYVGERVDFLVNSFSVLLGLICGVGVVLGIIGTIQKEYKKLLAIIGLVLNVLVVIFISWGWISVILGF